MKRIEKFQVPDGEVIQAYKFVSINALYLCNMVNMCVLGVFEVIQYCSCGNYSVFQVINTKTLHVFHMKVLGKLLHGCLFRKYPVIEVEDGIVGVEIQLSPFDENLLWGKVCQHLVDILPVSLVA